jgi:hypothetical protein
MNNTEEEPNSEGGAADGSDESVDKNDDGVSEDQYKGDRVKLYKLNDLGQWDDLVSGEA